MPLRDRRPLPRNASLFITVNKPGLLRPNRLPSPKSRRSPSTFRCRDTVMPNKSTIAIKLALSSLLLITFNNALASAVYSVHLKKNLHGAKVFVETNKVNVPGSLTMLKLSSFDSRTVQCKAIFDPRIEQKKSFKRVIKPNADVSIRYTTARTPNRLNISLECRALKEKPSTAD